MEEWHWKGHTLSPENIKAALINIFMFTLGHMTTDKCNDEDIELSTTSAALVNCTENYILFQLYCFGWVSQLSSNLFPSAARQKSLINPLHMRNKQQAREAIN